MVKPVANRNAHDSGKRMRKTNSNHDVPFNVVDVEVELLLVVRLMVARGHQMEVTPTSGKTKRC